MKKLKVKMPLSNGYCERITVDAFAKGAFKEVPVTINFGEKIGTATGEVTDSGEVLVQIKTDRDIGSLDSLTNTSFAYTVDWECGEAQIHSITFVPYIIQEKES